MFSLVRGVLAVCSDGKNPENHLLRAASKIVASTNNELTTVFVLKPPFIIYRLRQG